MVIVLGELGQITVDGWPIETDNWKQRRGRPSCCPIASTPLGISINEEYPRSLHRKRCGDVDRKRCLPDPTLLIQDGDNHARLLAEIQVSVETYFCISVETLLSSEKLLFLPGGSDSRGIRVSPRFV
jgi:hypothetical protein